MSMRGQLAKLRAIFTGRAAGTPRCGHDPREPLVLTVQLGEPEPARPAPCPICGGPVVMVIYDNGRGDVPTAG